MTFRDALHQLERALRALPTSTEIGELDAHDLIALEKGLTAGDRRLRGLEVACVGALETRIRSDEIPGAETAKVLRDCTGASYSACKNKITLARSVRAYPRVISALDSGELTAEAASEITKTLKKAPPAAVHDLEADLVDLALTGGYQAENQTSGDGFPMHLDDLRGTCLGIRHRFKKPDPKAYERRQFTVGRQKNGLVPVRGFLTPEVAAVLDAELNAITSPRARRIAAYQPDAGTARQPLADKDERSPGAKRHDAFAAILNMAASSAQMPSLAGAPVAVLLHTTASDLKSKNGGTISMNQGPIPVNEGAARHAACTSPILRVTKSPAGRVINLESEQRTFTAQQRRALLARDGGCVIPGCDTPGAWCEIHHVVPHAAGGPTHTNNGVVLCYSHHRNLGENGWEVRMKEGRPQVKAPAWVDGRGQWYWARKKDGPDL